MQRTTNCAEELHLERGEVLRVAVQGDARHVVAERVGGGVALVGGHVDGHQVGGSDGEGEQVSLAEKLPGIEGEAEVEDVGQIAVVEHQVVQRRRTQIGLAQNSSAQADPDRVSANAETPKW